MRVARRTLIFTTLGALAAPAVLRRARADTPLTLTLHHAFSAVSPVHDAFLVPWARKVEAESGGRLRIELFPSMTLGGAPAALFDQARDGAVDIAFAVPGLTPGRFPKIETFELPFVPSARALVSSCALQDFAAANLKDEFGEVHPICFSCGDRGVIHAAAPVRSIGDMKDLRLHVQTRLGAEAVRALGGQAVPMPNEELPAALAGRVIDGCVDPWHMVPTFRLSDALKSHTEFADWSMTSRVYALVMNKAAYDRLPAELKPALDNNSGQSAAALAGAMWDIQARVVSDRVAQNGDVIVTLLPEAVAHWRSATDVVRQGWLKAMRDRAIDGAKLISGARALLAKYENLPEPKPPPQPQQMPLRQQEAAAPAQQGSVPPPANNVVPASPPKIAAPPVKPVHAPPPPKPPAVPQPATAMAHPAQSAAPAPHASPATAPAPAPAVSQAAPVASHPAAPSPSPPAHPVAPASPPPAPATPVTALRPVPPAPSPAPAKTLNIPF